MEEEEDKQWKRLEKSRSEALSFSPSFNSYSSHRVTDFAEKNSTNSDDIEFSFVRTSDEIFGEIFPVFNRDLLTPTELTRRNSLRKLFDDEDGKEGGNPVVMKELENVPVGTYSVWMPNIVGKNPAGSRCKRSNSTKTWKPRYSLLRRSNSEGKESKNSLLLMTPKKSRESKGGGEKEGKILVEDYKLPGLTSRLSLEKLLFTTGVGDKGRDLSFSSTSGADELESVPRGTYSVWRPKSVVEKSPSGCKKSKACFC